MYTDDSATTLFPDGMEPDAAIQAFDEACNSGDVARVLKFFAAESVVRLMYPPPYQEPDTYSGQAEIRRILERYLDDHLHIQSSAYKVALDQVTWQYQLTTGRLQQLGIERMEGSAGATFAHGRILHLTLSLSPESAASIIAALDRAGTGGPISEGIAGRTEVREGETGQPPSAVHGPRPHLGPTWDAVGPAKEK